MTRLTRGRLTNADLLAVLTCGGLATFLALFFRGYGLRLAVPVMFVLVIITVAQLFNRLATILIAAGACLIFALVLFEPYGTLLVENAADRLALIGFAVCALAAILCSPKPARQKATRPWARK
ncbi:MAG TPA: DUF4118 domain-containing protein [Dongiaceae bacterium]|nr:DUF4118 domain-containing protein [Dongiaceae bacterium]